MNSLVVIKNLYQKKENYFNKIAAFLTLQAEMINSTQQI